MFFAKIAPTMSVSTNEPFPLSSKAEDSLKALFEKSITASPLNTTAKVEKWDKMFKVLQTDPICKEFREKFHKDTTQKIFADLELLGKKEKAKLWDELNSAMTVKWEAKEFPKIFTQQILLGGSGGGGGATSIFDPNSGGSAGAGGNNTAIFQKLTITVCNHSKWEHLFEDPFCKSLSTGIKVLCVAFHIFTLAIPLGIYHLTKWIQEKMNQANQKTNSPTLSMAKLVP